MMNSSLAEFDVAELATTLGQLARRMRTATARQELSWPESAVVAHLVHQGPATTAELARAESVRPQSMRTTLAGLEAKGLVRRKPHPTDGRQVNIALTARGVAAHRRARQARRNWLGTATAQLSRQEQDVLRRACLILQKLATV